MNERTYEYRLVVKRVIARFLDEMNEPRLQDVSQSQAVFWFKNLTREDIETAYAELRRALVNLRQRQFMVICRGPLPPRKQAPSRLAKIEVLEPEFDRCSERRFSLATIS